MWLVGRLEVITRVSQRRLVRMSWQECHREGLLEGRTMVIMAQSPFWAMVGRAGIADHQWSSWAKRQKPWSSWATGLELTSPWAKRVGRVCNQWQEGHFGHKGMVTWVGSFIWRWQWHGQQVLGKFNWASLI